MNISIQVSILAVPREDRYFVIASGAKAIAWLVAYAAGHKTLCQVIIVQHLNAGGKTVRYALTPQEILELHLKIPTGLEKTITFSRIDAKSLAEEPVDPLSIRFSQKIEISRK